MTVSELDNFSPELFIRDVKRTCAEIDAPFAEGTTRAVIEAQCYCAQLIDKAML